MIVEPAESEYLVPFDGTFSIEDAATAPPKSKAKRKKNKEKLAEIIGEVRELQRVLYADDRYSLLLVFQAMDAAGKDGTIRAVMSGINPAGCQVFSFKQPSSEQLDHDFLWRVAKRLPERGRIGIFNRSHYEEVLVVRVHPEYLSGQQLPPLPKDLSSVWESRYESIRGFEQHLAHNGTVILKFFLNVSRDEQKARFLARIDEPEKNWKFSKADVAERKRWNDYMAAYEDALNATSRPWAPWYAIPADDKPYMRRCVAQIVCDTLAGMDIAYPKVSKARVAEMKRLRAALEKS